MISSPWLIPINNFSFFFFFSSFSSSSLLLPQTHTDRQNTFPLPKRNASLVAASIIPAALSTRSPSAFSAS